MTETQDRVLRDHSGVCVHGIQMYCGNVTAETGERCPGGRRVTREDLIDALHQVISPPYQRIQPDWVRWHIAAQTTRAVATAAVDAALRGLMVKDTLQEGKD